MTGRLAGLIVLLTASIISAGVTYAVTGAPAPAAPIPLETGQQAHPSYEPTFARNAPLSPRTPRPYPSTRPASLSGSPSATVGASGTPGPAPSAEPSPDPAPTQIGSET